MRKNIEEYLRSAISDAQIIEITIPEHAQFGHFSTNVALRLAKARGKSPMEVAEDIAEKLRSATPEGFFEKIEAVSPGFVNIWLTAEAIQASFKEIYETGENWGRPMHEAAERLKTVVVDYSAPNIAKPMGVGHLRSTVIGQALYNIFKFNGWNAIGDNHLGDWGKQFGVLIAAYKEDGMPEEVTIDYLMKLYVGFSGRMKEDPTLGEVARKEVKKLQDGDEENLAIWRKFYDVSLAEFDRMYALLNVSFDHVQGESFYNEQLPGIVEEALTKGIAKESEGAIVIPIEGYEAPMIIRKSDGAYLYPTTDLATLRHRVSDLNADRIVYVVGNEQSLHFEQLFKAAKKLEIVDDQTLVHVKFGLMLGEDMKKFSTRAGKTVSLFDLLQEAILRARKVVDEKQPDMSEEERQQIAEAVGLGAVKYNDLSQNRQSDIAFNWDRMLSFEGNSGPYLQYAYARLKSILRKGEKVAAFNVDMLKDESELQVILRLQEFPEVIEGITKNYFPHHLSDYLYVLAKDVNTMYQAVQILKADEAERNARLALIAAAAQTLKTGLELLGLKTLEQM
ncbi:MAG: Arginine-tRNA ligase [Candidatus Wolfebacteria bacterium GW2011_GWC2_46_275]|nr:MAG: Arginine-tRNA ligase [Candidatus Wolfebacteria bacterium GW2011_GWC2_46_275]KKU73110.1 MAG: Arginine-tRNA ligase [Candidatus Wolfebacteria bacterium GW2011_GWB1_47_243]KKU88995.1 MAG: Arginine-tRNA ligase [Candidatus Wolfebacteria bacterium GW2011_GWA2_47_9b]